MAAKKTEIDMRKLERDLQKFGKRFGDTTAQAVTRWGVQVCRELAKDTFSRGKRKGERGEGTKGISAQKEQFNAIEKDAHFVLVVVDSAVSTGRSMKVTNRGKTYSVGGSRFLHSAADVNTWIGINRTRRRRRTAKLAIEDRKVCLASTLKEAIKDRMKSAGAAKGGWLIAGLKLARRQTGAKRIEIGARMMPYAQKAAGGRGSATASTSQWNPSVTITNSIPHSSSRDVLPKNAMNNSIKWGLKKTINWYRMAMRPKKTKP